MSSYRGNGGNILELDLANKLPYAPKAFIITRNSNLNDSVSYGKGGFIIGIRADCGNGQFTYFHDVQIYWYDNKKIQLKADIENNTAAPQYICNSNGIWYTYIVFY